MKTGSSLRILWISFILLLTGYGCSYIQVPVAIKSIEEQDNRYFIIHQQHFTWWLTEPVLGTDTLRGYLNTTSSVKKYEGKWVHVYINSEVPFAKDSLNPLIIVPFDDIISVEVTHPDKKANAGVGLGILGFALLLLTFLPAAF